jgi:hypothetical protein
VERLQLANTELTRKLERAQKDASSGNVTHTPLFIALWACHARVFGCTEVCLFRVCPFIPFTSRLCAGSLTVETANGAAPRCCCCCVLTGVNASDAGPVRTSSTSDIIGKASVEFMVADTGINIDVKRGTFFPAPHRGANACMCVLRGNVMIRDVLQFIRSGRVPRAIGRRRQRSKRVQMYSERVRQASGTAARTHTR